MKLGLGDAIRTRVTTTQKPSGFGNAWDKGTRLHVFFPIFWAPIREGSEELVPQILTAADYMHGINNKMLPWLKRIAIPSNSVIDEEGVVVKEDIMYRFYRFSRLFIDGMKNEKIAKVMNNAQLKGSAQAAALKGIEDEFEDISPAIGKLDYKIATEVVVVEVDDKGKFKRDTLKQYSMDLSTSRGRVLTRVMQDIDTKPIDGESFIEVKFNFGSSGKKKEDGKVDPVGTTAGTRVRDKDPELWKDVEAAISLLPDDSDAIRRRNSSFQKVAEDIIFSAIHTYALVNLHQLATLPDDQHSQLKSQVTLLDDLKVTTLQLGDETLNIKELADEARSNALPPVEKIVVPAIAEDDSDTSVEEDHLGSIADIGDITAPSAD